MSGKVHEARQRSRIVTLSRSVTLRRRLKLMQGLRPMRKRRLSGAKAEAKKKDVEAKVDTKRRAPANKSAVGGEPITHKVKQAAKPQAAKL